MATPLFIGMSIVLTTLQAQRYDRVIEIWIEYNWNFDNDTMGFTLQYTSFIASIKDLLNQTKFIIDNINDVTANKHDLVYVEESNFTETLHIEMNIIFKEYDTAHELVQNVEKYVRADFNDDIINKYNHTELTEGLLNIISIQCDITKYSFDWIKGVFITGMIASGTLCWICVIVCLKCGCCRTIELGPISTRPRGTDG